MLFMTAVVCAGQFCQTLHATRLCVFACRMAQQALHNAQARLDQLQRQCDEAFKAYEANTSDKLTERYEELKLSLHKAEDVVSSLAEAHSAAHTGWQIC